MKAFYNDFTAHRYDPGLDFLRGWQRVGRFGGVALSIATILLLVGLLVGTRRSRVGVLLFGASGLAMIVAPALTGNSVGRYVVPMAGPMTAAAAIALFEMKRRLGSSRQRSPAPNAPISPGPRRAARVARVTELRLHHRRAGRGEPLVAIHGIGSSWRAFSPILPMLEERHDVLAISLPGYGESPPSEREPTVPVLVDAVQDAMDQSGFSTAHLVGNSLGGWIAAELAARGRARSVAAISPAGMWTPKELRYATAVLASSYEGAQRLASLADRITASAVGRRLTFGLVCARPERISPDEACLRVAGARAVAQLPAYARVDCPGQEMPRGLEQIDCPFGVIWGSRDLLLPRRQAPRWVRYVRGAELFELPRLGHLPMSDDPGRRGRDGARADRRSPPGGDRADRPSALLLRAAARASASPPRSPSRRRGSGARCRARRRASGHRRRQARR